MTGSFRSSDGPADAPRRLDRARLIALARFEIAVQLREPLTGLYALVFLLLTFGYSASEAVVLVSGRGDVPRHAPWALMLAFGGLTAFGQVITTMIATTAMLRDETLRTSALILTSGVPPRTWFLARVSAALAVMALVYAALPIGALLGTIVHAVSTDQDHGGHVLQTIASAGASALRAYGIVTLPTVLVVTLLLASAAVITRRVLGVLAVALVLVGLWQLALALEAQGGTRALGALLDPFGNAPVLAVTAEWTPVARRMQVVPLTGLLLANRLLWLGVAAGVATGAVHWNARTPAVEESPAPRRPAIVEAFAGAPARSAVASLRWFTAHWMAVDGGWRTVAGLAVLNALLNAVLRPLTGDDGGVSALLLVSEHARLFLILLATVYAGELCWRERDLRIDEIMDTLPVSRRDHVAGRVQGLLLAQGTIVGPLAIGALLVLLGRGGTVSAVGVQAWLAWTVFVLWLPFAHLTVLSLAVHALIDHKVGAHLLLITGWVLAVTLDRQGVTTWWLRFAEPAPLVEGLVVNWGPLAQRGAYWTAVSAALLLVVWRRWPSRARAGTNQAPTTSR
ncbi:MAG: hypothetical protein ACK5XT_09900 [Gemmatimonas sp.]|uniref:hypothetical protein n=1 Tax=Gemmatimonas sp. TaxID=1962908 RepID=UPI00391F6B20|nr:hypothetical protein [Gemmatimonadota bacterium]